MEYIHTKNNRLNALKKLITLGLIILLVLTTIITTQIPGATSNTTNVEWDVTLDFRETSGKIDYVVFGEAPDANDGSPHDSYDVMKPPAPMQPYLRAWFDDNLPMPYNMLWEDYRQHPDTEKVWDLYVRWKSSSPDPTIVTISWDLSEFDGNEYDSIILNRYNPSSHEWEFAVDVLTEDTYTYTPRWYNEQWLTDHFQIVAMTDITPPETTCELEGELEGDVYISDVIVTLEAVDDRSGVDYTMYSIDGDKWQKYEGPFVVPEDGEHIVRFYSVDYAENKEDNQSCTFTIQHPCYVEIEIAGDFRVNAVIKNTGEEDIADLEWSITLEKGLVFIGREKTGVIESLPAGKEEPIHSFVFGIGRPIITVTAGCAELTVRDYLLILIFLIEI